MNRRQAAQAIHHHLHHQHDDGSYTHFDNVAYGDKENLGIYVSRSGENDPNDQTIIWRRISWKEVLKFIREFYPRRIEDQCKHKYPLWNRAGTRRLGYASCTQTCEHLHCASCGAGETAVGVCSDLCYPCTQRSNKLRSDITWAMIQYEESFSIPFKPDTKMLNDHLGKYDDDGYYPITDEDIIYMDS